MQLVNFPLEIIDKITSNLNKRDVISFTRCNSYFYHRAQYSSYWKTLCELNRINYCHPEISWKELFCSGDLPNMCTHISSKMLNSSFIKEKKQLIWSHSNKNDIVCLDSSCGFIGN